MFVAYVILNLDNGHGDLEILGCADTPQGALDFLSRLIEAEDERFSDYRDWDNSKSSDCKYNDAGTREYGYQKVPFVNGK